MTQMPHNGKASLKNINNNLENLLKLEKKNRKFGKLEDKSFEKSLEIKIVKTTT